MIRPFATATALAIAIAALSVIGFAQESGAPAARGKSAAAATSASPVNINTASAVELQSLPNVGPAMAARILEYRQKSGGFKKIEDLMNVKGIGEKSFLKLKPLVVVSAPAPAKAGER